MRREKKKNPEKSDLIPSQLQNVSSGEEEPDPLRPAPPLAPRFPRVSFAALLCWERGVHRTPPPPTPPPPPPLLLLLPTQPNPSGSPSSEAERTRPPPLGFPRNSRATHPHPFFFIIIFFLLYVCCWFFFPLFYFRFSLPPRSPRRRNFARGSASRQEPAEGARGAASRRRDWGGEFHRGRLKNK